MSCDLYLIMNAYYNNCVGCELCARRGRGREGDLNIYTNSGLKKGVWSLKTKTHPIHDLSYPTHSTITRMVSRSS